MSHAIEERPYYEPPKAKKEDYGCAAILASLEHPLISSSIQAYNQSQKHSNAQRTLRALAGHSRHLSHVYDDEESVRGDLHQDFHQDLHYDPLPQPQPYDEIFVDRKYFKRCTQKYYGEWNDALDEELNRMVTEGVHDSKELEDPKYDTSVDIGTLVKRLQHEINTDATVADHIEDHLSNDLKEFQSMHPFNQSLIEQLFSVRSLQQSRLRVPAIKIDPNEDVNVNYLKLLISYRKLIKMLHAKNTEISLMNQKRNSMISDMIFSLANSHGVKEVDRSTSLHHTLSQFKKTEDPIPVKEEWNELPSDPEPKDVVKHLHPLKELSPLKESPAPLKEKKKPTLSLFPDYPPKPPKLHAPLISPDDLPAEPLPERTEKVSPPPRLNESPAIFAPLPVKPLVIPEKKEVKYVEKYRDVPNNKPPAPPISPKYDHVEYIKSPHYHAYTEFASGDSGFLQKAKPVMEKRLVLEDDFHRGKILNLNPGLPAEPGTPKSYKEPNPTRNTSLKEKAELQAHVSNDPAMHVSNSAVDLIKSSKKASPASDRKVLSRSSPERPRPKSKLQAIDNNHAGVYSARNSFLSVQKNHEESPITSKMQSLFVTNRLKNDLKLKNIEDRLEDATEFSGSIRSARRD